MNVREWAKDISSSAVASFLATASDGLVFGALRFLALPLGSYAIGIEAWLASMVGGVVHYLLMSQWVFRRFEQKHHVSIPLYAATSLSAGVLHGLVTQFASTILGASIAWVVSKIVLFVFFTFPLSRFVVFGPRPGEQHQESV